MLTWKMNSTFTGQSSALLTDLYQLTMLQGYFEKGMKERAVFEFYVRKLPDERNFLIAAGLEQVLTFLENLCFTEEELAWVADQSTFNQTFVDSLARLRFTGDVHAVPEGTILFPDEPSIRVTAPIPEAQLVESRLINLVHFQTLIASKAARSVLVAPDKLLVDFGMRRAHGAEAGVFAARASYLAGFAGTATVVASPLFGVPVYGTMAHSFIQAHDDEAQAFEDFARAVPEAVVLLIDTYDTEKAAGKVVELAPRLEKSGITVKGVRLDSGDLADHARKVRRILDEGGLENATIFASGSIDEYALRELLRAEAPIDGFGIGTRVDTSEDVPYLDSAYKLVEYAGVARRKRSEGKELWPGRKQVYRRYENDVMAGDVLTLESDPQEGVPLLEPVMRGGKRVTPAISLQDMRECTRKNVAALPEHLRSLEKAPAYPVRVSDALRDLASEVDARIEEEKG